MMGRLALAALVAALSFAVSGCARLAFDAANLPVLFRDRVADLRYAEGERGRMDLYPATRAATPRPLVVFFYGGNFTAGAKADYRFAGVALARAGYVTVIPDYRVYPAVRWPGFVQDAARAVVAAQRLAAERGADPHRVVLVGHSAGAYLAAMLALEPSWLREAGGDPADVAGFVGLSGPYDIDPNTAPLKAIFDAVATPDQYRPLRHVRAGAPPALLLHGAKDDLVGVSHSEKLAAALRAAGTNVRLKIYPGLGHADTVAALSLPARRRADTLAQISAFLASLPPAAGGAP